MRNTVQTTWLWSQSPLSSSGFRGFKTRPNLSSADLSYADLSYADLSSSNLGNADLRFAILRSAELVFTNLRSANLNTVKLSDSYLGNADFSNADLSNIRLNNSIALNTDFRKTKNLHQSELTDENLLICNSPLPEYMTIDKDRDCDEIVAALQNRYPGWFENLEAAQKYVNEARQKTWDD